TRAQIGSTVSFPQSRQRRAYVESKVLAQCSRAGSDAFAASIAPGSIVNASVLLKLRVRRIQLSAVVNMKRSDNLFWSSHLPHEYECGVPLRLGTPHSCGRKEFRFTPR